VSFESVPAGRRAGGRPGPAKPLTGEGDVLKRKKKSESEKTEKKRQFIGFRIGEELYGIGIEFIQEIDRMHSITKLPKSLPFIEGVINLRGAIIPVIDVAKRFGMPAVEIGRRTRIIITRISGQAVGLIVEQVTEVVQLEEKAVEPAPAMAFAVDQKYVEGVGRIEEGLLIILNLELLFSIEEMNQLQTHPMS
jgi:purine-binding chemotaxis protein CheW